MPLRPQRSITKTYAAVPQRDSTEIELASVSQPITLAGTATSAAIPADQATADLEMSSRPSSPVLGHDDGVEALQSWRDPYMNRFRLLSACSLNLMNGLSDAAAGPLIPYMEKSVFSFFFCHVTSLMNESLTPCVDTTALATQWYHSYSSVML